MVNRFEAFVLKTIFPPLFLLAVVRVARQMNPISEAYFRRTREPLFGAPFEELCPPGPKREEKFQALKAELDTIGGFLDKNGTDKAFVMGDSVSFSDFILGSTFLALRAGVDSQEWEQVLSWSGGRWGTYLRALEEWEVGLTDGEEIFHA